MQYLEMITASKTWECPKTGVYKITCVGGGASGGYTASATVIYAPVSGGITSFGDLVTAAGGGGEQSGCAGPAEQEYGGIGGYTPYSFGGAGGIKCDSAYNLSPATGNGGNNGWTGTGYGASGGGFNYLRVTCYSPSPTEMIQGIFTLAVGDSYEVTIGEGGDILTPAADGTLTDMAGVAVTSSYASSIAKYCTNGRSGVCVVQYLGQDY